MIPYNTEEKPLPLPEYGRNIQRMIDHCLTIEDRDERTRCAKTIADIMSAMFPEVASEGRDNQKIWDHMVLMSDFKLDVDFPCEVLDRERLTPDRSPLPYNNTFVNNRQYGRNIQSMLGVIAEMENCIEKDQLIFLAANQMKKQLLMHNPEIATDERVFGDISSITGGRITIDPSTYKLNDYLDPTGGAKVKKRKK